MFEAIIIAIIAIFALAIIPALLVQLRKETRIERFLNAAETAKRGNVTEYTGPIYNAHGREVERRSNRRAI